MLAALRAGCARLGLSPRSYSDDDPRNVSADAPGKVESKPCQMDDPGDRRLGLVIRSAAVESLIKPRNRGRKGTEPFRKEGDGGPVAGASG
jgi:hypothetical protein